MVIKIYTIVIELTRMKTSISSEALTQFGAEEIAFLPKPDGHMDIRTDGQTDICNYREANLIPNFFKEVFIKESVCPYVGNKRSL